VQVKFLLNNEGIFSIDTAFFTAGAGKNQVKHTLPFEWESPNMKRSELKELRALVASTEKDEKKEALEKSKTELQDLVDYLQPLITGIKSIIGKTMLEKEIDSALAMLSESNQKKTNHEQVEKKKILLEGMKSKYKL
jgi:hypothetical protein